MAKGDIKQGLYWGIGLILALIVWRLLGRGLGTVAEVGLSG